MNHGVVTIERIADDGTIRPTVLGPPSEKNIDYAASGGRRTAKPPSAFSSPANPTRGSTESGGVL
jgi:hypothetical protein